MIDKDHKQYAWWRPAVVMFARVTAWVAIPVLGALFIGRYLDGIYNTAPIIFLSLTGCAFIVSIISIVKVSREYSKSIEDEIEEKKKNQNNAKSN